MPNEPVQCPNCGGGDVRQLAPDSYECQHCHTNFHWVDPTRTTVAHTVTVAQKPGVCKCGNTAVNFCYRCQEPVCQSHRNSWPPSGGRGSSLEKWTLQWFWFKYYIGTVVPRWVRQSLEKHRVPEFDPPAIWGDFLCTRCWSECSAACETIMESLRQAERQGQEAARQGQACGDCLSEDVQGRCIICGVGVCSQHGIVCERCHQLACAKHVAHGRLCTQCGTTRQCNLTSGAVPWLDKLTRLDLSNFRTEYIGPTLGFAFWGWVLFGFGGCIYRVANKPVGETSTYCFGAFESIGIVGLVLGIVFAFWFYTHE